MKATKKILSVFLAVLMALSCLTAAFPTLSLAAASDAQWNALKTAVQNAGSNLKTGNITISGATSATSRTITDKTTDSSVYLTVQKLYDIINAEMGKSRDASYNYPASLLSRIKGLMPSKLGSSLYTGNAKTALDSLLDNILKFDSFKYTTASKHTASKYYSDPDKIPNIGPVTVTVKRSRDAALMTYTSIGSVPATVETSFSMKITIGTVNDITKSGTIVVKHNLTAWYYFSGISKTANVSTESTNISILKTYLNYFTKAKLGQDPYTTYSFEKLNDLNALVAENTAQQKALADAVTAKKLSDSIVQYFAKKQYGDTTAVVDDWCTECASAAVYFSYKDKVDWLAQNIEPMDEARLNALDYSYRDVEEVRSLLKTGMEYFNYLEKTVKTSYATAYERYVSEGYDAQLLGVKLDAMKYYVDCYDLAKLKAEMDAFMALYPDCKALDDTVLGEVYDKMVGYLASVFAYDEDVIATVFTDGTTYATSFRDDYFVEITYRDALSVFAEYTAYFSPFIENTNNDKLYIYSTEQLRTMLDEGKVKYAAYLKKYNEYRKTLPADYMSQFDAYGDEIGAYLDALPVELLRILTDEVETAIDLAGGWTAVQSGKVVVTLGNFAAIKAAVNAVETDVYDYLNTNYASMLTSAFKTRYEKVLSLIVVVDTFVNNFLNNFKQVTYDDAKGVYAVRSVLAGDLARVEGEDYTVSNKSIETLINKLDDFIGSSEFTDLLGQIMENGKEDSIFRDENGKIMNLTQFVDKMLVDNLYNDETVTAVMKMFYPMVYKEVTNLLNNLLKQYDPLDLNSLTNGTVSGTLDLAYNGASGSSTFESLYSMLGLSITPKALAAVSGMSAYPAVRNALNASGNNWDKVVWENLVWNVKDYNTFVSALATCLDGIHPLLQILLCNSTQTKHLTNAAHVSGDVKKGISVGVKGLVSGDLTISGYTGFKDIVIPIYEALGLTDYSFTVPAASASTKQILDAVLRPLLTLVDRVTTDPLNTLLAILPNLVYGMITDRLTELTNFNLNIHYQLSVQLDEEAGFLQNLWKEIKQAIVNAVQGNLKGDVSLNLKNDIIKGSLSNLIEIKGQKLNYTDLNWLVNYLLSDMLGFNLRLPLINAGNIITASTLNKSASSKRSSGKRVNFTTDKADLFYVIWNYLCSALADEQFVSQLYNMIAGSDDGSVVETPELLADICRNLGAKPDDALAAVNEFFVPQTYRMKPYDWYADDEAKTPEISASGFAYAYLQYTNDWTDAKAAAVLDNIDDITEQLLRDNGLIGEEQTFGEFLASSVDSVFTNDLLTTLIRVFAENLVSLGTGAVGSIIRKQFGADLSIWATRYGALFEVDTTELTNQAYAASKLGELTYETVEPTEDNKNGVIWSYQGKALTDGDRAMFTDVLMYAVKEFAPISNLILCGEDLSLFGGALTLKGYASYDAAVIPLAEALGVSDVLSQKDYIGQYKNDSVAGLNYVINTIFRALDNLTTGDFIYNLIDIVPDLLYFLQSGGLSSFLINFLKPLLVLLDTARPIYDLDANGLLQGLIDEMAANANEAYDPEDETRFMIDVRDVDLNAVYAIAEAMTGLSFREVLQYAVEGLFYTSTILDTESKSEFLGHVRKTPGFSAAARYEGKTPDEVKALSRADSLTVLLCLALDFVSFGDNAAKLDALLGGETNMVQTLLTLLHYEPARELTPVNWYYFAEGVTDGESFAEYLQNAYVSGSTISYLKYAYGEDNGWTEASASYMSANLAKLIDMIVDAATDSPSLNDILTQKFTEAKLYTRYNVDALGAALGKLLEDVPAVYAKLAGIVLDLDLDAYKQYVPDEADKNVVLSKQAFAKELANVLAPIAPLLDWLLLGKDYRFLTSKNGEDAITLRGANGYAEGIAPVLEALAVNNVPETAENSVALAEQVILAVLDKVESIVSPADGKSALTVMLDLLPNVVYFLNADGLTAAVNNLLLGVSDLLKAVEPLTGKKVDLNELLNGLLSDTGVTLDVNDLSLGAIASLIRDLYGLDVENAVAVTLTDPQTGKTQRYNYLSDLYVGEVHAYPSVSSLGCYRMENTPETQRDVLTVLLCAVLDIFRYEPNRDTLVGWFGTDVYNAILGVLTMPADASYQGIDWLFTDGNGNVLKEYRNKVFSPLENKTDNFDYGYDKYWTREKAKYVAAHLNDFINSGMELLGIEFEGEQLNGIGDIVERFVGDSLYTNENAAKLAKRVADAVGKLLAADPSGEGELAEVIRQLLNVDLTVYEKYSSGDFDFGIATGDRAAFADALVEVLMPLEPILRWLLTQEDITLLVDKDGGNAVTLHGGQGYKYAVLPILEALDRTNPSIKTATAYCADAAADSEALVRDIVDPVLDLLDHVMLDPANNLLAVLPGIIYFIDSKGLDTCFKNLTRPVTDILEVLEPLVGEINLYDVLGFDLETLDFNYIFGVLLDRIAAGTGEDLAPLAGNVVSELTVGKLVSFTSRAAEGDSAYPAAYTMEYVEGEQSLAGKADMITILLRLGMKWVTDPENQPAIRALIEKYVTDEKVREYVIATYETLLTYLEKPDGVNMMLGVLYYIFRGLDAAVEGTNNKLNDVNEKWSFLFGLFGKADSDYLKNFGKLVKGFFGVTDDVFDENGIASNGLIPFFKKIVNWLRTLIDWIKQLFNKTDSAR